MLLEQLLNPGLTRDPPAPHPLLPTFPVFSFWEGDLVGPHPLTGSYFEPV